MPCCLLKKARTPWFPYCPRSTILLCQTSWLSSIHRKWSWKFSINEEGKTRNTANRSPYWHPFYVVFVLFCFVFIFLFFVFFPLVFFSFALFLIAFFFHLFFWQLLFLCFSFFFLFFFFQFFFSNCVILCFCLNIQLNQSHYLLAALSAL